MLGIELPSMIIMKLLTFTIVFFALVSCTDRQSEDQSEPPQPPATTEPEKKTVGEKISEGGAEAAEKLGEAVDEGVEKSGEAAEKAKDGILKGVDKLGEKMREGADKIDKLVEEPNDTPTEE